MKGSTIKIKILEFENYPVYEIIDLADEDHSEPTKIADIPEEKKNWITSVCNEFAEVQKYLKAAFRSEDI